MVELLQLFERIKKREKYPFLPGSVENVFFYNDKCSRNMDGTLPVCIKIEREEKKNKKSLN